MHLLTAAVERLGGGLRLSVGFLSGFLGFLALEMVLGRHTHDVGRSRLPPLALLNLLGEATTHRAPLVLLGVLVLALPLLLE